MNRKKSHPHTPKAAKIKRSGARAKPEAGKGRSIPHRAIKTRPGANGEEIGKSKPDDWGIATTLQAASSRTGLPMRVVLMAKAAGCPAFTANGRIDCDALLKFVETMPQPEEGPNFEIERALNMQETRLLKKVKREQLLGMLRPQEEVRRAVFRNVVACKQKLYAAESTISVEIGMRLGLTNEQLAQVKEIAARNIRQAIAELHGGELGKVKCPECRKEIK
jgi:hypothetical protein